MSDGQVASSQAQLKRAAAVYAVEKFVRNGMHVGLGSGSTSEIFVEELAKRVNSGQLPHIVTVATSTRVATLAKTFGLMVLNLNDVPNLDVTVDGADEIQPKTFALIKGRGGALLREKLVATASKLEVIIADESKLVTRLGERMPVPVEIIAFGWKHTANRVRALGFEPVLRNGKDQKPYVTDGGNYILDCRCPPIDDPTDLAALLKGITGVVEHGLFIGIAGKVVIATPHGIRELEQG